MCWLKTPKNYQKELSLKHMALELELYISPKQLKKYQVNNMSKLSFIFQTN